MKFLLQSLQRLFPALAHVSAVVLVSGLLVFACLRFGMPAPSLTLLSRHATDAEAQLFLRTIGVDRPLLSGYLELMRAYAHGEFGASWVNQLPIQPQLLQAFKYSVLLMLPGIICAHVLALVLAARSRGLGGSPWQSIWAQLSVAAGLLLSALLAQYLLASTLIFSNPFPAFGLNLDGAANYLESIATPTLALTLGLFGFNYTIYDGLLRSPERQRNMLAAQALGFSRTRQQRAGMVAISYPLLSFVAGSLPIQIVGGAVVIEVVYATPGLGLLGVQACLNNDAPMVMALTISAACMIACASALIHLLRSVFDPRLHAQAERLS
jgi:peptide/nickel transport system permease protein